MRPMRPLLLAPVLLAHAAAWRAAAPVCALPATLPRQRAATPVCALSAADEERLLLSEVALNAFIVAEVRSFVTEAMAEMEAGERKGWRLSSMEKLSAGLIEGDGTPSADYKAASAVGSKEAVDMICDAASKAFSEGFSQGLLSQLGSAISFFRNFFRSPRLFASCERVGLSDYAVAHHISDMYHHRTFRGTYTKTLAPNGVGEVAARAAVGLPPLEVQSSAEAAEEDDCLIWSPTGVCLQTRAEADEWRKRRFERVQMEGTRDPRRGGSGTTR